MDRLYHFPKPKSNAPGGSKRRSPSVAPGKEKLKKKDASDLSEEDLLLKEQLELYVLRAQDLDPGVQRLAVDCRQDSPSLLRNSATTTPPGERGRAPRRHRRMLSLLLRSRVGRPDPHRRPPPRSRRLYSATPFLLET